MLQAKSIDPLRENVGPQPALSVIVPVYNASSELQQCLAALASSSCGDFQVLVVDDGSDQPVESLVRAHGFDYMRIKGPLGPAQARNRGVAVVQSPYIVFVDADVCVHQDTLERFRDSFAADLTVAAVIGSYDDAPAHPSFLSRYKNLFHHYVHQQCAGDIGTFWSGCGAIRRDLFLAFGGFDEQRYRRPAIEDIELGTWMSASGCRIILDRGIKAKHLKHWTFWKILKSDIFDRGIPWTRLMLRAGSITNTLNVKPTQKISVTLVYLTIAMLLFSLWSPYTLAAAAASALVVTYLNLDFYDFFLKRQGWWFTLRVLPLHWLYFFYCGFCFFVGSLLHYLDFDEAGSTTPFHPRITSGNQ
jgi:glycosyltransferase involved in cell wall biosynthesis